MENSFYTNSELKKMGFKEVGTDCMVSCFARFYGIKNISIGNNVRIDDFCILSGNIQIGSFVHIASYSALYGSAGIIMHDFSGVSSRVVIYSSSDDYMGNAMTGPTIPDEFRKIDNGTVILKRHALVGSGSVLLPNTKLEIGATIGALSLVKGDIPSWSIYSGIPAKFRKKRKSEIIKEFEKKIGNT